MIGGNPSPVREFTDTDTDTKEYSGMKNLHQPTASVSVVLQSDVVKTFLGILTDPEKLDKEFSNMLRYAAEQQSEKLELIPRHGQFIRISDGELRIDRRLSEYIKEGTRLTSDRR